MDDGFFTAVGKAFDQIINDSDIRVIIIRSEGKLFTAGLDLKSAGGLFASDDTKDKATQSLEFYHLIKRWQKCFSKIQECPKPVIAAIHNKCIGGGVDLISWCDIRLCTADAEFAIKETKLAMVADLGTMQRIGRITSQGFAREMAFTGEPVSADRALQFGLVNQIYPTVDALVEGARKLALQIAENSPLAVQGSKIVLNHADEHSQVDGLEYISLWNAAFLQSGDLGEAVVSWMEKRKPTFRSKL
eukprot:TRINITY_DN9366_c0_g1_i1.p1 TRINITY_DN9366_c0_g1~~TRINITY_DN9366_c0_g1_i1.p1  ORF type:complete len:277 (-),score=53.88 TRINITY_DN9366_c0_g1_i1:178-915(-)